MIRPQVPVRAAHVPAGDRWIHEIKHDGYRMLCRIQDGVVQFISRRHVDWTPWLGDVLVALHAWGQVRTTVASVKPAAS